MAQAHDVFLDGLSKGVILTAEAIEEWEQTDNDEALEELIRVTSSQSANGYDVEKLSADVKKDRDYCGISESRGASVKRGE